VIPALPALLRGKLWTAAQVDVKVSVDASGNVVKAEALPKPAAHPLLRDAAVQAAQRWRFKSAQFDGHPVPAEMVVQFNFAASR
jgi:TonB family protein